MPLGEIRMGTTSERYNPTVTAMLRIIYGLMDSGVHINQARMQVIKTIEHEYPRCVREARGTQVIVEVYQAGDVIGNNPLGKSSGRLAHELPAYPRLGELIYDALEDAGAGGSGISGKDLSELKAVVTFK